MNEDLKNIKKVFKNQKKPNIIDLHNLKKFKITFRDPLFPPDNRSLFSQDIKGNYLDKKNGKQKKKLLLQGLHLNVLQKISWKRAKDINPIEYLYSSKLPFDNIKQGMIGDCYFISTIAEILQYPNIVKQIFNNTKYNSLGYYELLFFIDGEWQIVILDDYFPFNDYLKTYLFVKSEANLLAVMLIEKAWAKIHGGYSNIIGTFDHIDHFCTLTGFPYEYVWNKSDNEDTNNQCEYIFNIIKKNLKSKSLLTTNSINENYLDSIGIGKNHAYSILDYEETNKFKMIKLYNPWGNNKYQLEFDKIDENDKPLVQKYIDFNNNNSMIGKGTFWIDIEHYIKYFVSTNYCKYIFDGNATHYTLTKEMMALPLIFNLVVRQKNSFCFGIFFENLINLFVNNNLHSSFLVIVKYGKDNQIEKVYSKNNVNQDLYLYEDLDSGNYTIWIYVPLDIIKDMVISKCVFSILSQDVYTISYIEQDVNFTFIHQLTFLYFIKENSDKINDSEFFSGIDMKLFDGIFIGLLFNNTFNSVVKIKNISNLQLVGCKLLPPEDGNIKNIENSIFYPNKYRTIIAIRCTLTRCIFKLSTCFHSQKEDNPKKIDVLKEYKVFDYKNIVAYKKEREKNLTVFQYKTTEERKINIDLKASTIMNTVLNSSQIAFNPSQQKEQFNFNPSQQKEQFNFMIGKESNDDNMVNKLVEMGFPKSISQMAMNLYGNNYILAIEYLFANSGNFNNIENEKPTVTENFSNKSIVINFEEWMCKYCLAFNNGNLCKCSKCGRLKINAKYENVKTVRAGKYVDRLLAEVHKYSFGYITNWICKFCTSKNSSDTNICMSCGNYKTE